MGCFRTIGCLVVLAVIVAAAWLFRAEWLPLLHKRGLPAPHVATAPAVNWEPLSGEASTQGKQIIQRLSARGGPVFANLSAAQLTSYIFQALSKELPPSAQKPEAAVIGDELHVRASVRPADIGADKALGPLGGVLGEREMLQFGGTLDIVRPGLGEYHVKSVRMRDITLPAAMIPRLLRAYEKGSRPSGVADDALPLVIPVNIGDVRIHDGKITVYKVAR